MEKVPHEGVVAPGADRPPVRIAPRETIEIVEDRCSAPGQRMAIATPGRAAPASSWR
jgi:hypothetical protein